MQIDFSQKIDEFNEIFQTETKNRTLPGIVVSVFQNGKEIFYASAGYADIEKKTPFTHDTVFRWASVTKTFTAIGFMQLLEQGKIKSLDDPVNNYLPKGKGKLIPKNSDWPEITFRHLLTHTSGIGEIPKISWVVKPGFGMLVSKKQAIEQGIPRLSTLHDKIITTSVPAGSKFSYSNFGFSTLGYITEVLSGERWEDYIHHHILDPLEMKDSDLVPSEKILRSEAKGYKLKRGKFVPAKYWVNIIGPAGNLYATIPDLQNYGQMILNKGLFNQHQIIKPETLALMQTPTYYPHEAIKNEYALGLCWFLYTVNGRKIVEHGGANAGFTSTFTLIPEDNTVICLVVNKTEIFGRRDSVEITNLIVQKLVESAPDIANKIAEKQPAENRINIPTDQKNEVNLKRFCGYYGPNPGVLTNTRTLMSAGDYKISIEMGMLVFSSLYGTLRSGKTLLPTKDPLVFCYIPEPGHELNTVQTVAFTEDNKGNITHLGWTRYKLRKNKFFNTLRFKLYVLIGSGIVIGFSLIGFLIGFLLQ